LSNYNKTTATKILNSYTREHTYNINTIKFKKKKEWNNYINSLLAENTQDYKGFKQNIKDSIEQLKQLIGSVPMAMNTSVPRSMNIN